MKLGLLEVGCCNAVMEPKYGRYPPLFRTLIGRVDPSIEFASYKVLEGVIPDSVAEADAWLITGSRHGVYEDIAWLPAMRALVREAYAQAVPTIGVCFGHQLLAQALGGEVVKAEIGWRTGVQAYEVFDDPAWFGAPPPTLAMHANHQDQVIAIPEEARVLARSETCPYAALAFGPGAETRAISIQPHPEFDAAFERDLILSLRGTRMDEGLADDALATIGTPVRNDEVAEWFVRFLRASV